ncbi:MAG: alkyl hydroperoxide reductase [Acidobacteria bacterium]|nr:MAG: alkyl hydroperoxide reductase [Acidobacteriota bacterium]
MAPPRQRNPLALAVVALVAAGMLFFGFQMARRSGTNHPIGIGYGTPAPDFTLETLDGKSVSLSSLRGKAVVVNFGLQIVGVAMDDSGKDEIARFAKDMGMNYPVVLGKEAVGDAYGGVPALPESFFIGRDGKIVDKIMGLEGRSEIEDAIKKALNTQAGSPATVSALIGPK